MANTDPASQLTQLYNKLVAIDSQQSKLALKSEMNTKQTELMTSLNALVASVSNLTAMVEALELNMSALLAELRSK
jgi:hypothetical protein